MADREQSAAAARRVHHVRDELSDARPPVSSQLGSFLAGPVQDELQLLEFMLTREAEPGQRPDGHQIARAQIAKHGKDRYPTAEKQLAKVADELVELGLAIGRESGSHRYSDTKAIEAEYADVGLALYELGNKLGIDLIEAMRALVERDGRKFGG